jgi:phosphoribosylformylglycinamidine synthase
MARINKIIFVERKHDFNNEAIEIFNDLKNNLNIESIVSVRIVKKYLISNIDITTFKKAINTIFCEPQMDSVFLNEINLPKDSNIFAISYLPGQYDQRADSCEQCLKLIEPHAEPMVKTANIYILEGKISINDLKKIKKYLINPIDSQEIDVNFNQFDDIPKCSDNVEIIKDFQK